MKRFLREYRVELIALFLAALGVFLLVEQLDIRKSVWTILQNLISASRQATHAVLEGVIAYLNRFTLSDLVGLIFLLGATIFVFWRVRYRFLKSERWRGTTCPKCGGTLVRVHRTTWDRILTQTLLPYGGRFRCKEQTCGWSGLRYRGHHGHHRALEETET